MPFYIFIVVFLTPRQIRQHSPLVLKHFSTYNENKTSSEYISVLDRNH